MQALQHAGVAVPVVVPTTSGALYTTRSGDGLPGEIQIDLFEWIDGEQLGSVEEGLTDESSVTSTFATIGELAAQVHNQASNWTPPEGFVRHAWDADGLAGEQPVWGRFWDYGRATPEQQELMLRARETIYERLSRLPKTSESYSMIHADFAPENVLVDGDRVRLIDFDDAGFGWHMFEIATSLYFVREEPAYQAAFDAIIDGYRRYRDLDDETLAQLPVLNLARAFAYVGWVHTRPETETAQELGPTFLQMALDTAQEYWDNH